MNSETTSPSRSTGRAANNRLAGTHTEAGAGWSAGKKEVFTSSWNEPGTDNVRSEAGFDQRGLHAEIV